MDDPELKEGTELAKLASKPDEVCSMAAIEPSLSGKDLGTLSGSFGKVYACSAISRPGLSSSDFQS